MGSDYSATLGVVLCCGLQTLLSEKHRLFDTVKHMLILDPSQPETVTTHPADRRPRGREGWRKADDTNTAHLSSVQTYFYFHDVMIKTCHFWLSQQISQSQPWIVSPSDKYRLISVYFDRVLNISVLFHQPPHRWRGGGVASFLHEKLVRDSRRLSKMFRKKPSNKSNEMRSFGNLSNYW